MISWWARQMADLAEPLLNKLRVAEPDALLAMANGPDIQLLRRRKGRTETIATATVARKRRNEPVTMVLASPLLLCNANLPAAALPALGRVLRYEMDRLTPFSAEDVYFSHRLLAHDRARGMLQVEVAIVPCAWVQPMLDRLRGSGVNPVALEAPGPDGTVRRISILQTDQASANRHRLALRAGLVACAIMAIAVIAVPLLRQTLALADTAARIESLRPLVRQAEGLRKRIATGTAGIGRIAAARQQAMVPLQILAILTDTLPDDTWLNSLTMRQKKLVIEGHSAAATKLIAAMGAEPRLQNPAFAAPVLRSDSGGEVFTIQAEFGS